VQSLRALPGSRVAPCRFGDGALPHPCPKKTIRNSPRLDGEEAEERDRHRIPFPLRVLPADLRYFIPSPANTVLPGDACVPGLVIARGCSLPTLLLCSASYHHDYMNIISSSPSGLIFLLHFQHEIYYPIYSPIYSPVIKRKIRRAVAWHLGRAPY
jgi:hypothetical protein